MLPNDEKSIQFYKNFINAEEKELEWMYKEDEEYYKDEIEQKELLIKGWKNILNLITKLLEENKEKDNKVRQIINRLDNDIFRISKSKESNKWDDYRRCRLKSYKTKTREIKEYIEQEYFKKH